MELKDTGNRFGQRLVLPGQKVLAQLPPDPGMQAGNERVILHLAQGIAEDPEAAAANQAEKLAGLCQECVLRPCGPLLGVVDQPRQQLLPQLRLAGLVGINVLEAATLAPVQMLAACRHRTVTSASLHAHVW